jgi:hypothetical protein
MVVIVILGGLTALVGPVFRMPAGRPRDGADGEFDGSSDVLLAAKAPQSLEELIQRIS